MPLRSPKMYFCIFGFQRFVWWPKCTPASSSSFMVSAAIVPPRFASAALPGVRPGPIHARRVKSDALGRVLGIEPDVFLAQVARPDGLFAPPQPEVDGDRVLRPSHDLANSLQAHAFAQP